MPKVKLTDLLIRNQKPGKTRQEYWDEAFTGGSFGVRVTPRGEKSFILMYRFSGRLRRLTLGKYPLLSLSQARKKAREALGQVAQGNDPAAEKSLARKAQTFEELANLYIERYAKTKKKPKSIHEDRRILKADLLPAFGTTKAVEIRKADIIELLDTIAYDRNAPIMANRTQALLSKIFNFGVSRDLLPFNPCSGLEPRGVEKSRERVLTDEEIKALWLELEEKSEPTASLYRLLLLTGQRSAEVKSVRWTDIDDDFWTIPEDFTKNGKEHKVPLSTQAMAVLDRIRPENCPDEYVFPSRNGGHIIWLQKTNQRLHKKLGFHFTPHDLRRTVATSLSQLGIDDVLIARILNHSWAERNITSVDNRRKKLPEMRQALERWGSQVERIVSGKTAKVVRMK